MCPLTSYTSVPGLLVFSQCFIFEMMSGKTEGATGATPHISPPNLAGLGTDPSILLHLWLEPAAG